MKPVLQALVLADHVYEAKDGKKIIAGTFNLIVLSNVPKIEQVADGSGNTSTRVRGGGLGAPYVYMSLTDVVDNTELELQLVNLTRNEVICSLGIKIPCDDRLATVEYVMPLPPPLMLFQEPGTFAVEIVCEGEVIGSHRITVIDGGTN